MIIEMSEAYEMVLAVDFKITKHPTYEVVFNEEQVYEGKRGRRLFDAVGNELEKVFPNKVELGVKETFFENGRREHKEIKGHKGSNIRAVERLVSQHNNYSEKYNQLIDISAKRYYELVGTSGKRIEDLAKENEFLKKLVGDRYNESF